VRYGFDSRWKPILWLPFWPNFCKKIWPELESSHVGALTRFVVRAGLRACSRSALRLRFQMEANTLASFLANYEIIGQNWNRTSDTRIFSPLLYRLSYLAIEK
jgi:hypothetical protein